MTNNNITSLINALLYLYFSTSEQYLYKDKIEYKYWNDIFDIIHDYVARLEYYE